MFNTENPVVRDELWTEYSESECDGYDDEDAIIERAYACANGDCKGCIVKDYCHKHKSNNSASA